MDIPRQQMHREVLSDRCLTILATRFWAHPHEMIGVAALAAISTEADDLVLVPIAVYAEISIDKNEGHSPVSHPSCLG